MIKNEVKGLPQNPALIAEHHLKTQKSGLVFLYKLSSIASPSVMLILSAGDLLATNSREGK